MWLIKKKKWMPFDKFAKRLATRTRLLSSQDDVLESTRIRRKEDRDMFGMFKR